AAVSAADADHAGDRRIPPRRTNRGRSKLRLAGHVALPREHRLVVDRIESEPAELGDAAVELCAVERAGGSDHGDAIAGTEGAGLPHQRYRAISSAMARYSSRPIAARSAGPRAG